MPQLLSQLPIRKLPASSKLRLAIMSTAVILIVGGGAVVASNARNKASDTNAAQPSDMIVMTSDDAMAMERSNNPAEPNAVQRTPVNEAAIPPAPAGAETKVLAGSFTDYDPAKLADASRGDVVLFFSASWCPTCQTANKNFKTATLPDGLTLLKVNYDDSTDLKRKYGITYQHTFVQVDKDGNQIKKWSGSRTYDELKAQIN